MEEVKILLCCGAGMSSGFLASKARKYAKKKKIAATIEARSTSEVTELFNNIDILMLGPHYAPELTDYQKSAEPYGFPVVVIPQDMYAQLDGQRLVDLAIKTIEENK
ncbi:MULTISPECIES: PTS sugar transporter subunit IIB [unclassified Enterococcus]|uniref:PTS sugar transporter subunit IIB n=1 Tax=unclassified Enterococcus TaxID=2608891 RepID=UPI0019045360|nr:MULTISPECIES: PTS sugar transporter subunit IIB [unclassified Enterococcus]MBK0036056.1 PTS sugar transporter subunit IIB [Enterococcus sp. S52]MBK0068714.1 PTS sugar transporter subunit IIB [Enterococcus sp. S53]MBK0139307.1 PTS sugar transporter subunit IIB [Enterococcus sp. S76]MBK0142942.1 PTS sugar transporter subunit IIB [Enterococcus sp. S77]